jgi:hypothetical protein
VEVYLSQANTEAAPVGEKTLQVSIAPVVPNADEQSPASASGSITSEFIEGKEGYGDGYLVKLGNPANRVKLQPSGPGRWDKSRISLRGSAIANEENGTQPAIRIVAMIRLEVVFRT